MSSYYGWFWGFWFDWFNFPYLCSISVISVKLLVWKSICSISVISVKLLVWKSNYAVFNFTRSCLLSVINVAVSAIIVVIIILNQDQYASILDLYTLFIMGNLLIMVMIYCSIFVKLCQRVLAANHHIEEHIEEQTH